MEHPVSPPRLRQRRRIEVRQHVHDEEAAVLVAAGNSSVTNIYHLGEDLLRLSHAFLGVGHFRYLGIACKMFLKASEHQTGFKKITTSESAFASIERIQKYFEDEGTGKEQMKFFWYSVVRYDSVGIMRWADQQGYHASVDEEGNTFCLSSEMGLCSKAAKFGHLHVLQWLRWRGCLWNSSTCNMAAEFGHLHILQWARENGCDWNERTCCDAVIGGHLHILQWLRENGCSWDESICYFAAYGDHLHILQWARANGCDWDESVVNTAAEEGNLSVLQWATENGCEWDSSELYESARRSGNQAVLNHVIQCYHDHDLEIPDYNLNWNHV